MADVTDGPAGRITPKCAAFRSRSTNSPSCSEVCGLCADRWPGKRSIRRGRYGVLLFFQIWLPIDCFASKLCGFAVFQIYPLSPEDSRVGDAGGPGIRVCAGHFRHAIARMSPSCCVRRCRDGDPGSQTFSAPLSGADREILLRLPAATRKARLAPIFSLCRGRRRLAASSPSFGWWKPLCAMTTDDEGPARLLYSLPLCGVFVEIVYFFSLSTRFLWMFAGTRISRDSCCRYVV